jgi:predicted nucleotidyltransferase component of viral defense system
MMNKPILLSDEARKIAINNVFLQTGIFPQIIEKDLWVTTVLQLIFSFPFADKLVFKGGTSLSKVWNVIQRFSEDIDITVDRKLFDLQGDLTVKQIKKLRKQSSLFVKETFCSELQKALEKYDLQHIFTVEPQPDGEGDKTYPEPRKIFIRYKSLFDDIPYLNSEIVLEIGARALFEPTAKREITSMISETLNMETNIENSPINTAVPEKTFIEKAFLLHEIFTSNGRMLANRKSRHLYDLEKMMDNNFATTAISDNELWDTIRHHREKFTHINGVDYSQDIRPNISPVPPEQVLDDWQQDYETMQNTMIYGNSLTFNELINRIKQLEERIRHTNTCT